MYNPNDLSGFISPFNVELAVNARNKADAYTKSKNALRSGSMAAFGADSYGKGLGQKFLDEARAEAQGVAGRANMFGNIMGAVGSLGSFGVQGGFNNLSGGAQMQGPDVGSFGQAWNTDLNIGGYTPSEIYNKPNIGYNPFGG